MKTESIKFKAKRRDNGEWVEGDLMKESYGARIIEHTSKADNWVAVSSSTVCQFTGLKDCEGKEIWEGDIVHDSYDLLCIDNLYEVVYIEEEGMFAFKSLDKVDNYEPFVNLLEAYVVGNKFDEEE
ncbi:YopX family protein [Segatella sp.]|uniref:YopX family protein n=1 Tax=Segatella sp. TaxID=2974253 RepID=UPI003AB10940